MQLNNESLTGPFNRQTVAALYQQPIADLMYMAQTTHRRHHDPNQVQMCTLSNIKSGGCPEDCAYCSQSVHHATGVEPSGLLKIETVLAQARQAKAAGSTRFCMGAAWRKPPNGKQFQQVLELVRQVAALGMETCCTLGMLTAEQAKQLRAAGLKAYNHNLDTSPEFYPNIVTTRSYEDRLKTLANVRQAGIEVCCGGIIGLGESREDRVSMLTVLVNLAPPPESVPINALVPVEGTPLADRPPVDPFELVRTIATARCLMPQSRVRLAAGRKDMNPELQALCFLAGANSIFVGHKLLTAPNADPDADKILFEAMGLSPSSA